MVKRLIEDHSAGSICAKPWDYKVVVLSTTGTTKNDQEEKNFEWGKSLAHAFYHQEFTYDENDEFPHV